MKHIHKVNTPAPVPADVIPTERRVYKRKRYIPEPIEPAPWYGKVDTSIM